MKYLTTFVAAAFLSVGALVFTGCSSSDWNRPADEGATAGGNGAFGESPAQPGSYQVDRNNAPGAVTNAPTTQPSGS